MHNNLLATSRYGKQNNRLITVPHIAKMLPTMLWGIPEYLTSRKSRKVRKTCLNIK